MFRELREHFVIRNRAPCPRQGTQRPFRLLDLQMVLATGPCQAAIKMLGDMGEVSGELRKDIGLLHEPPRAVLESAVAELLEGTGRNASIVSTMISGMMQHAGALAMEADRVESVARELKKSVRNILNHS